MKRIISDAGRILKESCEKMKLQEEYLYRNIKKLLENCQKIIWSEQKEFGVMKITVRDNFMETLNEIIQQLQYFPVIGYLYSDILKMNYFSNLSYSAKSVRDMTGLGETAFFIRKRQAILALGLTLAAMLGKNTLEKLFAIEDSLEVVLVLIQNVSSYRMLQNAS